MIPDLICWCGSKSFSPFSNDYLKCNVCTTLRSTKATPPTSDQATPDTDALYSTDYWFEHQEKELGIPNIEKRSRADLPERDLTYLRQILRYKLPPGKTLELGSSHGGLVGLLKWAGFEAAGLELDSWVVDYAAKTFDVPVYLGAVEDQNLEESSFDAIVLIDVFEHLFDPVSTLSHCLKLLKPDGLIYIQTPDYPAYKSYNRLVAENDLFLKMLLPQEHVFLFSKQAITEFFRRLNVSEITFEPPTVSHNMICLASRQPFQQYNQPEVEAALQKTAGGHLIQALIDQHDTFTHQIQDLNYHLSQQSEQVSQLQKQAQPPNAFSIANSTLVEGEGVKLLPEIAVVEGKQFFTLTRLTLQPATSNTELCLKYDLVKSCLETKNLHDKSVLDLKGSQGLFGFLAFQLKARPITLLEQDSNALAIITKVAQHLKITNLKLVNQAASNYNGRAEIVFAFDLADWLYYTTIEMGGLEAAAEKLAGWSSELLLVEWIDRDDPALLDYCRSHYKQDAPIQNYNRQNFEAALASRFQSVREIGSLSSNRTLFVCHKTKPELS